MQKEQKLTKIGLLCTLCLQQLHNNASEEIPDYFSPALAPLKPDRKQKKYCLRFNNTLNLKNLQTKVIV
jgi:hypothetical protein